MGETMKNITKHCEIKTASDNLNVFSRAADFTVEGRLPIPGGSRTRTSPFSSHPHPGKGRGEEVGMKEEERRKGKAGGCSERRWGRKKGRVIKGQ